MERESRGAFHMKIRRGRLMQLGLLVVDFFERHRRPTRLEKYVSVREFRFTIENMLQIQTSVFREKHITVAGAMPQFPYPIVPSSVNVMLRIVTNCGIDFSDCKFLVRHGLTLPL